jgi:uncharacterized protein
MRVLCLTCLCVLSLILSACAGPAPISPTPAPTATELSSATPSPTQTLIATPSPTITVRPNSTPTATSTPTTTPTATPDPYAGQTIADLSARKYGGGEISIKQNWGFSGTFTRYEITYPSDGLTIYGFADIPTGEGPFPVIVMLHGYIDPAKYDTIDYTTQYADALARVGYIVLHPNLRGWLPSDSGPAERFRVGTAVDVLNLLAITRAQAGKSGLLEHANADAVGLWGHSMGGGISVRVLTVCEAAGLPVKAAVLYAAMSGDERQNAEWSRARRLGTSTPSATAIPDADLERLSPIHYLERVKAAVSIHHSVIDPTVPYVWSEQLYQRLQVLKKPVEFFSYPDQPHTFVSGNALFMPRVQAFYDKYLKGQ